MPALRDNTNGTLTVSGEIEMLAEDLYCVNGSFRVLPGMTFPLRMTIIRLPESRDLVVYSPFDPALVDVSSLGSVKAVVAPNSIHSCYAQSFTSAHPESTLYSSPALQSRFPNRDWGVLLDESCPPDLISPYVLIHVFTAFKLIQEIVLLHRPSRSVVAADLAFNYPPTERRKLSFAARWYVVLARGTRELDWSIPVKMMAWSDCKNGLAQMDKMLDDWEWDRFIPCHGAVVDNNAKATFRNGVYQYVKTTATREETILWKPIVAVAIAVVVIGTAIKGRNILDRSA